MTEGLRLEYGCGEHKTPGYLGVDIYKTDYTVASPQAIFMPVCAPGGVTEILSVHFVEHFIRSDVERLVRMWHGMLAPGGLLITCFPDVAAMSDDMTLRRKESIPRRPFDHVWGMAISGDPQGLYRHRSFWTAEEYAKVLRVIGFRDVEQVPYQRPRHDSHWTSEVRAVT